MRERSRPATPNEMPAPPGLGNRFTMGGGIGGEVTINYELYSERLPLGGQTVGEIRRIVGPRYDMAPEADVTVDGVAARDDTVVRAGQEVRFMHLFGEKGQGGLPQEDPTGNTPAFLIQQALSIRRRLARRRVVAKVTIDGKFVTVKSPEGRIMKMSLESLLGHLERGGPTTRDTRDLMLPDGCKWVISRGACTILVHQTPPAVHTLRWIASDSPATYGPKSTYREVTIALPYLIVFAVFQAGRNGQLRLGDDNECFFRTEPLRSPDDRLLYPALLNCSKFDDALRPLSWICTQNLVRSRLPADAGINERVRQGLRDLMRCMLEMGFNYSSDEHEVSSWFTESKKVDPRVSTIERWEEATREDPMFVSEVPWLAVGKSVREVAERILTRLTGAAGRPRTSLDVARVLYNHGEAQKERPPKEKEESDS